MKSSEEPLEALRKAVVDLQEGTATWLESVPVKEVFRGKTVWEGIVHVFSPSGILQLPGATPGLTYQMKELASVSFMLSYIKARLILLSMRYALRLWLNIVKARTNSTRTRLFL